VIDAIWILRIVEGIVLVLGAAVAYFSLQAYRRTHERSLLYLSIGFLLISLGAVLAGIVYELLTYDLLTAWIVASAIDSFGFLIILYSIVRRGDPPPEPVSP
jgi:branched-subunit amino acid ABC-type transport system permease component